MSLAIINFSGTHLSKANLSNCMLWNANFSDANLSRSDLSGADVSGSIFAGADLSGADVTGCNFWLVKLSGCDLTRANLRNIKSDFMGRLEAAKDAVAGLYDLVMRGRINGSYAEAESETDGCCFVGSIARVRGEKFDFTHSDLKCPTERWLLGMVEGDTPHKSQIAAITVGWPREFMARNGIAELNHQYAK